MPSSQRDSPVKPPGPGLDQEALFKTYYRPLVGFFRNRGEALPQAEDLAQEALLRAMRSLPNLRANTNLSTWIFTIAGNLWKNHRRATMVTGPSTAEVIPLQDGVVRQDEPKNPEDRESLKSQLLEEIEILSATQRLLVLQWIRKLRRSDQERPPEHGLLKLHLAVGSPHGTWGREEIYGEDGR